MIQKGKMFPKLMFESQKERFAVKDKIVQIKLKKRLTSSRRRRNSPLSYLGLKICAIHCPEPRKAEATTEKEPPRDVLV